MIKGVHAMFYSSHADELRAFFRDKLEIPASDIGEGWLIFDFEQADMGVHPSDESRQHGEPSGTHNISFYCDDIEGTVTKLRGKGVEFKSEIEDLGYGFVTFIKAPGELDIQLYQPKYK